MTKIDMARIVVQAMYAMKELPAPDDRRVKKSARTTSLDTLRYHHKLALKILAGTA